MNTYTEPAAPATETATDSTAPQAQSWRDILPIHPAAALFPRMSRDELRELGEDILAEPAHRARSRCGRTGHDAPPFCSTASAGLTRSRPNSFSMSAVQCALAPNPMAPIDAA